MSSAGAQLDTMFGVSNLDRLTKKDCYAQIIDSYRMRVEDDYKFAHYNHGLYAEEDPLPEFAHFLDLAEKRKGLLPTWWNNETRAACEAMGADNSKANWADLHCAIEKSDVMDHYKDPTMPMKLRLLAEKVYGHRVQGGL
jgi:splicing suppressor protein 51